jgi:hypothetical protein
MTVRLAGTAIALALIAACGPADEPVTGADPTAEQVAFAPDDAAELACEPMSQRMPLEGRASPYDSTVVTIGGARAKICYGRPSMRDREIFGGLVAHDTLWRTGANEPTTIHLPVAAEIAGIPVEPGSYSLYTVPGRDQWTIIVNRSTTQWGIESQYTEEIRAQEVGRARVPVETLPTPEETFTIRAEETGADSADVVLEWERSRVRVPVRRV